MALGLHSTPQFMRTHTRLTTLSLTAILFTISSYAQGPTISVGVIGGGGFTDAFQTQTIPTSINSLRFFSESKDWIVGPSVELRFTPHWSVEVDGMFRKLHTTWAGVEPDGTLNSVSPSPVVTWEFPVLGKYRFQWSRVTPFIEAGPSFRTAGNLNGSNPSHYGVTAGAGVEMHVRGWAIAPALRYTRWANDNMHWTAPRTNPNQVELLVGFSRAAESLARPMGRHFSVGVVAGSTITSDFPNTTSQISVFGVAPGGENTSLVGVLSRSGEKTVLAGPMVEFYLPRGFSLEVDALYHPLRIRTLISTGSSAPLRPEKATVAITWEFPVLAKYRLPVSFANKRFSPFIEAGPSFRLPQQVGADLSVYGATAGAGLEARWRWLKLASAIRYTHWAADHPRGWSGVRRNQTQLLVGTSF